MSTLNLLYKQSIPINEHISVIIPCVGDILENEDEYNSLISFLTAMPIDMMVPLDDMHIDFTEINAYELFILLFRHIQNMNTKLVFGDLDISKFEIIEDSTTGKLIIGCLDDGVFIDRPTHAKIANTLRSLHHIEKDRRKPANQEAKEYMIERARTKMLRRSGRQEKSQLEALIVAMVNTEQFKYNYEQVKAMSIYQFNESVYQIMHKVDCEHKMNAIYAGTLNPKDLNPADLNWISRK